MSLIQNEQQFETLFVVLSNKIQTKIVLFS